MAVLKRHTFDATQGSELAGQLGGAVVLELRDMRIEAEQVLAQARAEAERLLRDARTEAARIRAKASDEGRAEGAVRGLAAGLDEGRARGEAEAKDEVRAAFGERMQSLERAWVEAIGRWQTCREDLMREARRGTVLLALGIASRIVRRAVAADPDAAVGQLEAALELLGRATGVVVRCAAADRELLGEALPTLVERLGTAVDVTFVVDESLSPGDVLVRVAEGCVDGAVSTQLDRIAEALLPGRDGSREAIP